MKVLFFSRYGTQFKYFKEVSEAMPFDSEVVNTARFVFPDFSLLSKMKGLDLKGITQTHIKRKVTKYPFLQKSPWSSLYRWHVYASTWLKTLKFLTVIKRKQPDAVVVWNGHRIPSILVTEAAKKLGCQPMYFENGLMPDTTVLDPKGVNYFNSVPRDKLFYQVIEDEVEFDFLKAESTPRPVELPKRYIFAPFQVNIDTQILLHSPWLENMEAFYNQLVALKPMLGETKIVIKEHPMCKADHTALKERAKKDGIIFANDVDTFDLIKHAEAVFTINSTVGMESLMHRKKVVVLGDAFYAIKGLTLSAQNSRDLIAAVRHLSSFQFDESVLKKFMWYVKNHYLLKGDWRKEEGRNADHFASVEKRISECVSGVSHVFSENDDRADDWLRQIVFFAR